VLQLAARVVAEKGKIDATSHPIQRKGPFVARKRPAVSHVTQRTLSAAAREREAAALPTRDEAATERRSAPLMDDQPRGTSQSAPPPHARGRRAAQTPFAAAQRGRAAVRHRQPLGPDAVLTEELVAIVVRASQLGFSPWRVGIALRVPPMELAWICTRPQSEAATAVTLAATLRGASLQPPFSHHRTSSSEPGGADG
jgi:hypothetical protein